MQKLINVLALSSFVVSLTVVGGGVYLYTQKDAIVDRIQTKVMDAVTGAVPDMLGGSLPKTTGSALPLPPTPPMP